MRHLILALAVPALMLAGCASNASNNPNGQATAQAGQQAQARPGGTYNESELANAISDHMGVTAESAASTLERIFKDQGRPVGYITGEEGGGAVGLGAKYGKGTLWMKDGTTRKVYWQGPSVGFDIGIDVSRVFTLVYDLEDPDFIYRRYPGVEGSAYLVAGMAVHYQRANGVTLAPVRAGGGVRLGVNVGYTSFTKKRQYLPF